MTVIAQVDQFLTENKIHPEGVQMDGLLKAFTSEMKKGLTPEESSLAMIPTYIALKEEIPHGQPVIVMDAGGTNFRVCLVTFDEAGKPQIDHFAKYPMPGSKSELSKAEFFQQIVEYVRPIAQLSNKMGFCFSYAAEILPNKDGKLLRFSKEIKAPEVIGEMVGEGVLTRLSKEFPGHHWDLCMLNDTVATLLAGKAAAEKDYDGYIGFILGTGTNTCYLEKGSEITSIPNTFDQIINTESGGFDLALSPIDEEFFQSTKSPEIYHFEKMISGAYLGPFQSLVIRKAAEAALFSDKMNKALLGILPLNTIQIDDFMHDPAAESELAGTCTSQEDTDKLHLLIDRLTERTAKLTALNIAATILKTDQGTDASRPVCLNADGTTFHKTYHLKDYTVQYLDDFLTKKHGRFYEMVQIDDAPVLGAAIAGLQQ